VAQPFHANALFLVGKYGCGRLINSAGAGMKGFFMPVDA
jgi:hypothetical protein